MNKNVMGITQVKKTSLRHQEENEESELINKLVENIIKTKKTVLKSDNIETLQNTSIDILFLIDEFKCRFEKLGEKAREIALKDGRAVVTYDDAEEALKQIRTEKSQLNKLK
jgi:hypothetical protein